MANELVDLVKWSKRGCFMFKVDFEKEYDSVSYELYNNLTDVYLEKNVYARSVKRKV